MIEVEPGAELDLHELVAFCAERIAGYKKPGLVHVVDVLPRTVSGKVQKGLLRQQFAGTTEPTR